MMWLGWVLAAVAGGAAAWAFARLSAERRHTAVAERFAARESQAAQALAASDERARIAREMHDVVAHTLTVVVAQADGGRFAARTDPAAAARTLDTIADVGRSALTEMRALLGVLRTSEGEAELGPQPSVGDIPGLVATAREGGLDVSFVTTGTPRPLPIGAGLTLYRIAQEGLTNVRKHAGPVATAFLQLTWDDDDVTLTVSDDGRGAAAQSDGTGGGIQGMTERATVFGGTLTAGPKAGGGFLVRARLPLPRREHTEHTEHHKETE
ncbi:histidine kinase [Demequina sp. TTPB684]|uniref:sensor histidine kinase n=1 Tax=unclassified Demequina TaxID=2620311 RepID=UPI001CF3101E|nr:MULTISPECIES: histidine kinase [unclassified Demequina]MCB2411727.1 histidine kinase [Demequina sp. TTPB684]UPU87629.1 histidine kinase [Demequina sp. TMPB413]